MELTAHLITASGFSYFEFIACGINRSGNLPTIGHLPYKFAGNYLNTIPRSSKPLKFIGKRFRIKPWPMTAFSELLKNERFTKIIFS
jgi:hypothetical protein